MRTPKLVTSLAVVSDAPGLSLCDATELYPEAQAGHCLLRYEGPQCRAVISLQGAQVLAFRPRGADELLWMSPLARFDRGQPIRGGIPLCLPWFGPHPHDPSLPKHGFARLRDWTLTAADHSSRGLLSLRFELEADASAAFPFPFRAALWVHLGSALRLRLDIDNRGERELPLSWAFHSYLAVDELATARVEGLADRIYLDNTRQLAQSRQAGAVHFHAELDRVYTGVGGSQQLCASQQVEISGDGCDTVIVWNPGRNQAANMADVGPHYQRFVCVERGAAFHDRWQIAAGATASAQMTLRRNAE